MKNVFEKKQNEKGFTLAELLIVVAIIAVLVAIAIPVFTKRLEHAKETTDMANMRSAYAAAQVACLTDNLANGDYCFDPTGAGATLKSTGNADIAVEGLVAWANKTEVMQVGQGTATNGGARSAALPSVCHYDNGNGSTSGDVSQKCIKVTIAGGQVSSIEFA